MAQRYLPGKSDEQIQADDHNGIEPDHIQYDKVVLALNKERYQNDHQGQGAKVCEVSFNQ